MKVRLNITLVFCLTLLVCIHADAQEKASKTPTPKSKANQGQSANTEARQRALEFERSRRQDEAVRRLRSLGTGDRNRVPPTTRYREAVRPLYRKPSKKELKHLRPDLKDVNKYSVFLKQKRTGIIKLAPNSFCAKNEKVLKALPQCTKFDFPGNGASYSFRAKTYRLPRMSDITFDGNSLVAEGVLVDAIFGMLENVSLDEVSLSTKGVQFIANFAPAKNTDELFSNAQKFAKGFENNGFIYGRAVFIDRQVTYVLRTIAYRGKQMRTAAGFVYNEFDFDKRRDSLVAFRVLGIDKDGNATVIWKELRNQKAPKLQVD